MAEDNISNIINNFKNMLNNTDNSDKSNNSDVKNDSQNLNITPEMIGNLANILKSNSQDNSSANSSSSNANSSSNSDNSENNNSSFASNIDFETILKIKTIMETLNKKDDPRSNLLYSLKPYLRESRQKKLDQYVNLFKITQISNLFKNEKGDKSWCPFFVIPFFIIIIMVITIIDHIQTSKVIFLSLRIMVIFIILYIIILISIRIILRLILILHIQKVMIQT